MGKKPLPLRHMPPQMCRYCESIADTWDHAIPKSRGGPNTSDNKFPTCSECNNDKRHMTHEEYVLYLYRGRDESIRILSEIALLTERGKAAREQNHRDRIYNNRIALCIKALEYGVPMRALARAMGKDNSINKLRRKLNRRMKLRKANASST